MKPTDEHECTRIRSQILPNRIEEQLSASGIAQVLVVLKAPEQAAAAANTLSQHFRLAATAPQTALASALAFRAGAGRAAPRVPPPAPMRVYAHLGLMLGTVDAQGLAALRADTRQVAQVASAPQLSLIRPVRKARPSRKGWVDISNW